MQQLEHQRAQRLSRVRLSATPWTLAPQAPPSVGIPQARTPEQVAHALLPGTLLMEGLNPRLLNWQVKFLPLGPAGKPSVEFHYSVNLGLTGAGKCAE